MRREELRSKFSETVGIDKAEAIVDEAAAELGIEDQETFTSDEIRELCEEIQHAHDGYVSDVANEIRVHEQAEERFRTLLQNIPDPAVVVDFDDEDPVVRTVNEAFERTFGYGAEATGERLADLIVPTDARGAADVWFRRDRDEEVELTRVDASGQERTFLFRAALAHRAGGAVEGYGIYTDITDRERRERQLQHQNQQLEQFVSVVSHDLRNPLNVADGNLELAMDLVEDESLRRRLESVASAHEQMAALIDDLLTLARQGRSVGETEPVDIEEISRMAWANVPTGEAVLETDFDHQVVAADASRLGELFGNLYRNAVEHVGPEVTVRVGSLEDGDGFYLEDDGPGIPPAKRDDVFERGYSSANDGTGFGLSIVESIVEAHGWSVELTAGADGGARFELTGVQPA